MSFKPFGYLFFVIVCLVSFAPKTVMGANSPVVVLRVGEHTKFDRIVLDLPENFNYKFKRDKSSVSIVLDNPISLKIKNNDIKRAKGFSLFKKKISFIVDPKSAVTHFKNDNSIVIDVKGKKISDSKVNLLKKRLETKPTKKQNVLKKEVINKEIIIKKEKNKNLAPTPKSAPIKKVKSVVSSVMDRIWPPNIQNPMKQKDVKLIRSIASEKKPIPIVVFDPKVNVGLAVFERAGYVTILFDRKLSDNAFPGLKHSRVHLIPFSLQNNIGYRIRVPSNISVRAARDGTAWKIFLIESGASPLLTTEFITQPNFALGARMLVPSSNPPTPVHLIDPVVGDKLIVIPFQEAGAFAVRRNLSDFQVVPSVQGLVIKPWHDRVTVRVVSDGIEVSSEGGLNLSSQEDMGTLPSIIKKHNKVQKQLFDFKRWNGRLNQSFEHKRQKLWQTIINVDEDKRVLARLDLARLYFANGLGYESLSILEVIHKDLPDIEQHQEFLSLRGAARILVGKVTEGLKDLSNPIIKQQSDIILWKAVGNALMQDWKAAVSLFRSSAPLLLTYPEPMRSRFWVLAIESAIATNNKKDVIRWLSKIEHEGYDKSIKYEIMYLKAVLHSQSGRVDLAEKLWNKVTEGNDRLYKIRSELSLIDLGVATGSMSPKQAIDRLEGLRFAWRGDGLELDILKRLGVFYINNKEYRKGFETLFKVLNLFPDAPQSKQLYVNMVKTFQDLFLTDLGKELSPIEGLSLYTDFQSLIPKDADGNVVRRNLADRLVDIDLLDQAVSLLNDVLKNSRTKKEKVDTALRIAGIRLLDHKAHIALNSLEKIMKDAFSLSNSSMDEWKLLNARALSETGKYYEALASIPSNENKKALLLRADIALKARNWSDATNALMKLVGPPPKKSKKLSEEKAEWIVRAALAMARNQDGIGLDKLAIDYGKSMSKTKKANVFHVLTRADEVTQLKDIQSVQSNLNEVDMFSGVLDSYRKGKNK